MAPEHRAFARFALVSALGLGLVLGLVWSMALQQRQSRMLFLEFEAYRTSASLLEIIRQEPSLVPEDGRVLGFGIYAADGIPIARTGSAPASLDPAAIYAPPPPPELRAASLVLMRPLGPGMPGAPGARGMRGDMMGGTRRGPGMGRRFQDIPAAPGQGGFQGFAPGAFAVQPRAVWIEYGLGGAERELVLLVAGAGLVTAALLVLFAVLLALFRKNAEFRAREARNSELVQLGEAARTLAHEIKNPLGIIRIQSAWLRKLGEGELGERAARSGAIIEEETLRLARLADRIRDFLRGGEGAAQDVDLVAWLERYHARYGGDGAPPARGEAVAGIPEAARVLVSVECDAPATVKVDPDRLAQALDNLVANGMDADPGGEILMILSRRGSSIELAVADRGPGVPPEAAARLFEPFFTTKERGTGIGLALARRIVRGAAGELSWKHRPGGGALFTISLPEA